MALKENIQLWSEAVQFYENGNLKLCLEKLKKVEMSAKMLYNQAIINLQLHLNDEALKCFTQSIQLDNFLSVAYFQRSLLLFSLNRHDEADKDLESSLKNLRGSSMIDYQQLGLQTKLHAAHIFFNRAIISSCKGNNSSMQTQLSQYEKCSKATGLIVDVDQHIKTNKMVCLNPPYNIFCPPKGYVANLKKKDFLGKSEVISSIEDSGFVSRMAQKSHSNPSTPVTSRKNNLVVEKQCTRMAVTPPPSRPPPRLKDPSHAAPKVKPALVQNNSKNVSIPQRPPPIKVPQPQSLVLKPDVKNSNCVPSELSNNHGGPGGTEKGALPPRRPPPICDNSNSTSCVKVKPSRPPPPVPN